MVELTVIIIKAISFLIGTFISEVLTDFLVIKYKNKKFKLRINFKALNPFISHDKAINWYIVEILLIGLFSAITEPKIYTLIEHNIIYSVPIATMSWAMLYILAIKRLNIKIKSNRWLNLGIMIAFTIASYYVITHFFIL